MKITQGRNIRSRPADGHTARDSFWKHLKILAYFTVFGSLLTLVMDLAIDLDECLFDACRFVNEPLIGDPWIADSWSSYGTMFMHYIYGTPLIGELGFFSAFVVNALMMFVLSFMRVINIRWLMSSPLAVALVLLPLKEAWLIFGIAAFIESIRRETNILLRIYQFFGFLLLSGMVRPLYVFVVVAVFACAKLLSYQKGTGKIVLLAGVVAVCALGARLIIPEAEEFPGLDVPSSLPLVFELRNATAGFEFLNVTLRSVVYFGYSVLNIPIELARIGIDLLQLTLLPTTIISIGIIIHSWLAYKQYHLKDLLGKYLLISAVIAASAPFIHTRYLLPLYVAICPVVIGRRFSQERADLGRFTVSHRRGTRTSLTSSSRGG